MSVTVNTEVNGLGTDSTSQSSPYPNGAVPIQNSSGNIANGVATATIPAIPGKKIYITSIIVTNGGAIAGLVTQLTINGLIGGAMQHTVAAGVGALVYSPPLQIPFDPPLPANDVNVPVSASVPALGLGNTSCCVSLMGYYL